MWIKTGSDIAAELCRRVDQQISTKTLWIKTGSDLAAELCRRVDQQSERIETVFTGFERRSNDSMKSKARQLRKKNGKSKAKQIDCNNKQDTDLTKRSMKDILGTIATKNYLTKLLMIPAVQRLKTREWNILSPEIESLNLLVAEKVRGTISGGNSKRFRLI